MVQKVVSESKIGQVGQRLWLIRKLHSLMLGLSIDELKTGAITQPAGRISFLFSQFKINLYQNRTPSIPIGLKDIHDLK